MQLLVNNAKFRVGSQAGGTAPVGARKHIISLFFFHYLIFFVQVSMARCLSAGSVLSSMFYVCLRVRTSEGNWRDGLCFRRIHQVSSTELRRGSIVSCGVVLEIGTHQQAKLLDG